MDKITRVEKPSGGITRRSLFIVYFEDDKGKEYSSYQTPEEYNVTILKQELISKGVSEKDLDNYEKSLREFFIRENSEH